MTTSILALDTARVTGWAALRVDGSLVSGSKALGPEDMRVGPLLSNYCDWLSRRVTEFEPEYIFYEQPWVGPKTHQATALMLMSLAGLTHVIGSRNRVMVRPAKNPSVVKHFCGRSPRKRVERKDRVMAECRSRGIEPCDDNEADAIALLDYAAHLLATSTDIPEGPLFGNRDARENRATGEAA